MKKYKKCVYGKFKTDKYTKVLFKCPLSTKNKYRFEFNSDKNSDDWYDYKEGHVNLCYITSTNENLYEIIKNKKQYCRDLIRKIVNENREKLYECEKLEYEEKKIFARN